MSGALSLANGLQETLMLADVVSAVLGNSLELRDYITLADYMCIGVQRSICSCRDSKYSSMQHRK